MDAQLRLFLAREFPELDANTIRRIGEETEIVSVGEAIRDDRVILGKLPSNDVWTLRAGVMADLTRLALADKIDRDWQSPQSAPDDDGSVVDG